MSCVVQQAVFLCLNCRVCGLIKRCSVLLFPYTVTIRRPYGLGGDAAAQQGVLAMLCSGGIQQKPARNAGNFSISFHGLNSDQKLLTGSASNGRGMKLFGLCVMASGVCDLNVWKV